MADNTWRERKERFLLKHPERSTEYSRKYYEKNRGSIVRNAAVQRRAAKKYREANPCKPKVWEIVRRAILKGVLTVPEFCQGCKTNAKLHAHHEDYSRPLDVKWLCRKCHGLRHRKFGAKLIGEILS